MNAPLDYSDDRLIREIKSGNVFCFDLLYKRYCRKVFLFAFSILKCREEAENITQDVFLILWENRLKIEKDSQVKYYLFTIAYNSSLSVIRQKTRETQYIDYLLAHSECEQSGDVIDYDELVKKIDQIVSTLPPRQKEVYCLHKNDGLKYREIGERLNLSVNTVENHMSAALKTIRKSLSGVIRFLF